MIVASALDAGCKTLWSEDMHHGLSIDGRVQILNPFVVGA
jgi:predicted nucleic acid-binding protein